VNAGLSYLETGQQMIAILPQLLPQNYLSSTYQHWVLANWQQHFFACRLK
jgi:hypothetical protein